MRTIFIDGRETRRSLGHRDRKLAVKQAYELLSEFIANEGSIEHDEVTLGLLAALYLRSGAHRDKKPRTQIDDERKLRRIVTFLGEKSLAKRLAESDVRSYSRARREGNPELVGAVPGGGVKARTIAADLVALHTALSWATKERTSRGSRLLRENPLHGIAVPQEKDPQRPVMTHDSYLNLLDVARDVHELLYLALIIAEGTGRRISAWRTLRWEDVDFDSQSIRWRAENDKKGYEAVVPMSDAVRDALADAHPKSRVPWVFSAPRNPEQPCNRHLLDHWLRQAHLLANVQPLKGGMWHPLRRKWATERKNYPVKDIAAAGGWRDAGTVLRSYLQADASTMRMVVLNPTMRLATPVLARELAT